MKGVTHIYQAPRFKCFVNTYSLPRSGEFESLETNPGVARVYASSHQLEDVRPSACVTRMKVAIHSVYAWCLVLVMVGSARIGTT
jgi:hypothetical protein